MAINFPNSPSDEQQLTEGSVTYTYNATKGYWESTESSSNSSSSTTVVADMTALIALTGMSDGDQALVQATNKLYMYSGTGWYLIATIQNNAPSAITGVNGTYELAIDGTATTITAVSTDPEGFPLTWSSSTSGLGSIATISNTDNVFTITPSTTESDAGTFTLTINATDGVNGAVSTSTNLSLNFIVTVTNSKYTTLLATATGTSDNNDITDASTNNHSITVNGDAHAGTFSPYRSGGYSTYFDGSSDNISLTANSGFSLDGNFTIECWFNPSSITLDSQHPSILRIGTTQIYLNSSNDYVGFYYDTNDVVKSANSSIIENQWYHVSVTRSGSVLTLFLDGVSVDTANNSTATFGASSGTVDIGTYSGTGGDFHGYISDLRIVKGTAITPSSGGPTERLDVVTNTSLLTCHLPYIADGSTNDHSITVNGDVSTKPFAPYDHLGYSATNNGGSVYFDGTGDRITASTSNNFAIGSSEDFIIEAWIYPTNTSQGNFHLFGIHQATYTGGIYLDYHSSDFRIGDYGGGWDVRTTSTVTLNYNNWQHICASRTGNLIKIFFNGESLALSSQGEAHTNSYNAGAIAIGGSGVGTDFQGFISDIRFEKGTSRTSNFTPPTAPLSSSGAELHIKGTDASIIDKAQGTNLKLIGDTTGSTTQVKFANTKSMYFDGSGDYVSISEDDKFNMSGDFTIESWIWPSNSTLSGIFGTGHGSFGSNAVVLTWRHGTVNDQFSFWVNNISSSQILTSNIAGTNTWTHIAIVRLGSTITLYQNGSSVDTYTSSTAINISNSGLKIGSYWGGTFNGYLQDFRVTKGLARYTANFTPPTASLEG